MNEEKNKSLPENLQSVIKNQNDKLETFGNIITMQSASIERLGNDFKNLLQDNKELRLEIRELKSEIHELKIELQVERSTNKVLTDTLNKAIEIIKDFNPNKK